ncbi:hypothetical protein EST38_g1351 [Candolleomyces aberdarensis]|uniref:Small ribosomal subunit protein mS41 n=1 Tax=Candolleomyces aberdarensis TaxID=2316362 RepID=A0A4Q2DVQ5_9AGAR|nr:hypothetical protein EST38_g1351 [Candolleomyces aberdarensis]
MSLLSSRALTSQLSRPLALLTRSLATTTQQRPVPAPQAGQGSIKTAEDFLKSIGRESESKVSPNSWTEFWGYDGQALRKAGLAVRDRRYILWCMEKYRQGLAPQEFAHQPQTKKTVRGWGPKVQDGKRIRSKRIKDKTKKFKQVS